MDNYQAAQAGSPRAGYGRSGRQEMVSFIPPQTQRLLDVGCGGGGFGRSVRAAFPSISIDGLEPFEVVPDGIYDRLFKLEFDSLESGPEYDCIVFNDVLEHMVDPWSAVRKAGSMLADGGVVVASIPNVRNVSTLWALVARGSFEYTDSGVLDRGHLRFFTPSSMRALFEEAGFRVELQRPINIPNSGRRGVLRRLSFGMMDDWLAEQHALVARITD